MNARLNVSHHPISKHLSQALFWGVQHGHNCHNLAKGKISPWNFPKARFLAHVLQLSVEQRTLHGKA